MRYQKTTGTSTVQYHYNDNGEVVAEADGTGAVKANYVWGPDRMLVKKDVTSGNQYYYLYNGHGDVVQIVDASGNAVKSYTYDAFGNEVNPDANDTNPFRYCGEYFDKETGLYYLRARYYDPQLGRFLNEDSYEGQVTDPLSLNLYTYTENNPINNIDPTGHEKASLSEMWYSLWHAGWYDSLVMHSVAKSSLSLAQKYAKDNKLNSVTDNSADALRHFSWNYDSVQKGVATKDVAQVMTNHEIERQVYVGKDAEDSKYYLVAVSSLMDLYNNDAGRYQASLEKNKRKTSSEVFKTMISNGSLITSLDQVPTTYGFDASWIIPATKNSEASVIIRGPLSENPSDIVVVYKKVINYKGFKISGGGY